MAKLDSNVSEPLYRQLYKSLKYSIDNGEYKAGQKLPTELELCELYDVSRVTVRNALEELSKSGFITRNRGKGTYVSKKKIEHHLTEKLSFSETCILNNVKPGAKVIRAIIEKASPIDVNMLKINSSDRVVIIERIRYADGIPVSIEENRFTSDYEFLLKEDLNNNSIYRILKNEHNIQIIDNRATVEIVFATYEQALYLDVEENYPLLCITTCPIDGNKKPIHSSRHITVGDRFRFVL